MDRLSEDVGSLAVSQVWSKGIPRDQDQVGALLGWTAQNHWKVACLAVALAVSSPEAVRSSLCEGWKASTPSGVPVPTQGSGLAKVGGMPSHTVVGPEHAYDEYGRGSHAYGCMLATVGMMVLVDFLVVFLVDSYLS